jgi:hypothetical protein
MRIEHKTLVGKPEETRAVASNIKITHNGTVCGSWIGCDQSEAFAPPKNNLAVVWIPRWSVQLNFSILFQHCISKLFTLSTINPTWTLMGSKLDVRGKRPANNRLGYWSPAVCVWTHFWELAWNKTGCSDTGHTGRIIIRIRPQHRHCLGSL